MENKSVGFRSLKKGQEIKGHTRDGLSSSYVATVKDINSSYVTILMWGKNEQQIDSRSMFQVEMTIEEFNLKHRDKAKEILAALKNSLNRDEIGYHEMWNAWLYGTPYEMAQYCVKDNIKVLGYCKDIIPKTATFSGDTLDIGVCAEYEDGEKFWCHYRYSDIEMMFERYKDLI